MVQYAQTSEEKDERKRKTNKRRCLTKEKADAIDNVPLEEFPEVTSVNKVVEETWE